MTHTTPPRAPATALLVVGGGIAAYKSALVARELSRLGVTVETVLTAAAQRFVTGVTFAGLTGRASHLDLWDPKYPGELHIELTRRCDVTVVAPATADLLARMAHGLADDLATTCLLAARGPVVVAPAMHPRMWEHPATQSNVGALRSRGVVVVGPTFGALASGDEGMGRMAEPDVIAREVLARLAPRDLTGCHILVSAGGTHEALDPVRFLGNRSSGRMGYSLAERAVLRGAKVTLVSGPVSLSAPHGVELVRVRSAIEMRDAITPRAELVDAVIMAAAVADYRPAAAAPGKIKKSDGPVTLTLVRNPDILAELGARRVGPTPVLVGFAVETDDLLAYAREKLARKRCDLVVANLAEDGFEGTENRVTLVDATRAEELPRMAKSAVADKILDRVFGLWRGATAPPAEGLRPEH